MNARLAKLEALLGRIQKRVAEPRPAPSPPDAATRGAEDEPDAPAAAVAQPLRSSPAARSAPAASATASAATSATASGAASAAPSQTALPVPELELDEPGESVPPPADSEARDSLLPESIDELDEVVIDEEPESAPLMAEPARLTPPPGSAEESTQLGVRTGPTLEQVGATVALDEGPIDDLELDEPMREPTQPSSHPGARLEAELPLASQQGVKSVESAMEDLQRLRLGESTPVEARVSTRPIAATNVVDFVNAAKSFAPKSFLELLDASLQLK